MYDKWVGRDRLEEVSLTKKCSVTRKTSALVEGVPLEKAWIMRQAIMGSLVRLLLGWLALFCLAGCGSDDSSPPESQAIAVTTARGIPATVRILADAGGTGDSASVLTGVTAGSRGTVSRNSDHTVTYTPAPGFDGRDQFTYTLRTGQGQASTGAVTVQVLPADGLVIGGRLATLTPIFAVSALTISYIARGINDAGQIVGTRACVDPCPFFFDQGQFAPLPGLPQDVSGLSAINNRGQIVGGVASCSEGGAPFTTSSVLFDRRTNTALPIAFPGLSTTCPPAADRTFASGLNDAGDIVGVFRGRDTGGNQGFLRTADGQYMRFEVPGVPSLAPSGVNNKGQIVGSFTDARGTHGFLWERGMFTPLDVPGATATVPNGINDAGQVVGFFTETSPVSPALLGVQSPGHGFLWERGTFTLFDVPGASSTTAFGINNGGQIVGSIVTSLPPPASGTGGIGFVTTPVDSGPAATFSSTRP